MSSLKGWVGIDLDGTLATYDRWRGVDHIGEPIAAMVEYVKTLLWAGIEVRIFTARVQEGARAIQAIERWCMEHIGVMLPITDRKDFSMVFCVDDRAVSVERNTGRMLVEPPEIGVVLRHWDKTAGAPDPAEFKR